jgi:hypothetical protein
VLPVTLVKRPDGWKVKAGSMIAARKPPTEKPAAEKPAEAGQPGQK